MDRCDCRKEDLDFEIWDSIVRICKSNLRGSNEILDSLGLTNAQADVLLSISISERLSQKELADKLLVTKGNITQLLKKLEEASLVERDREWKTNYITLTEKGHEIVNKVKPILSYYQKTYFERMSNDEKKQLLEFLERI